MENQNNKKKIKNSKKRKLSNNLQTQPIAKKKKINKPIKNKEDNNNFEKISKIDRWNGANKKIKGKIISKSNINKIKKGLSVLEVLIADSTSEQSFIQVIFYGDLADRVNSKYGIGTIITLNNFKVKRRTERFNKTSHKNEIHTNKSTIIEEFKETDNEIKGIILPNEHKEIICINEMQHSQKANFMGIILQVEEVKTTASEKEIPYVDAIITDLTGVIKVRFWKNTQQFNQNIIGQAVICHNAEINEYNGYKTLNVWTFFNLYNKYSGNCKKLKKLLKWSNSNDSDDLYDLATEECDVLFNTAKDWDNVESSTITQIKSMIKIMKSSEDDDENIKSFKTIALFDYLEADSKSKEWYLGSINSSKKIIVNEDGTYEDENGNTISTNDVKKFYKFRAYIKDPEAINNSLNVIFFNKAGEQLYDMPADSACDYKFKNATSNLSYCNLIQQFEDKMYEFCGTFIYNKEYGSVNIRIEQIKEIEDENI